MSQIYTERDVNNFLAGMDHARKMADNTQRGRIAGLGILSERTTLELMRDEAKRKGRLAPNVIEMYPGAASCETGNELLADLGNKFPKGRNPQTRNWTVGRWAAFALLTFAVIFCLAWAADHSLKRVDEARQEIDAVNCDGHDCWGVE